MSLLPSFFTSSLGKKYTMGITGLLLVLFVLGHMTGNLLIFVGPEAINSYAEFLHEAGHGLLIWVARGGLLALFAIHLFLAFVIRAENKKARPVDYANHKPQVSDWAARHMLLSGLVILIFVLYHLAHFTFGITDFSHDWLFHIDPKRPHYYDVFAMVIFGFREPIIAVFYLVAQIVLATHLWHGASSWFQSVGLNRRSWRSVTAWFGPVLALVVFLGNSSIPIAVQAGYGSAYLKSIDPKDGRKVPNTMVNYTMGNVYPEEEENKDKSKASGGAAVAPPASPMRMDGTFEGKDSPKGGDPKGQSKGRPKMDASKGKGFFDKGAAKDLPKGESKGSDKKSP